MKRAFIIIITVLAVVLVYPSADLLAKSPSKSDSPIKRIVLPQDPLIDPWIIAYGDGEDDEDGDSDDIAGAQDRDKMKGQNLLNAEIGNARLLMKIWWMYFFHRIY